MGSKVNKESQKLSTLAERAEILSNESNIRTARCLDK